MSKFKKITNGQIPVGPYSFIFQFTTNNGNIDKVQLNKLQIFYSNGETITQPLELVSRLKPYTPPRRDYQYKHKVSFYGITQPLKLQDFKLHINYTVYKHNMQQKRIGVAALYATNIHKKLVNHYGSYGPVHIMRSELLEHMFYMP